MEDKGQSSVLVVDADQISARSLARLLAKKYRVYTVDNGGAALLCARNLNPDLILLGILLPGMDGFEVCRYLKMDKRTSEIPVVFVTSMTDIPSQEKGFNAGGVDYILKPFAPVIVEARVKIHMELSQSRKKLAFHNRILEFMVRERTEEVEAAKEAAVLSIAAVAELRNHETGRHLLKTKLYVRELANVLSSRAKYARVLTEETIDLIYKSSVLHDIGKVGIPDSILMKPGRLTTDEFEIIKTHTILGKEAFDKSEQISGRTLFSRYASEIAFSHHEKWNGTGYPQGLKNDEIPLCGRLMAVADVYDALTSERAYKPPVSPVEAENIIMLESGTHFDPEIANAFYLIRDRFADIVTSTKTDLFQAKMCI